ncbi:hypothetical protein CHUAL_010493 [Chamberlinius hualienensis]
MLHIANLNLMLNYIYHYRRIIVFARIIIADDSNIFTRFIPSTLFSYKTTNRNGRRKKDGTILIPLAYSYVQSITFSSNR